MPLSKIDNLIQKIRICLKRQTLKSIPSFKRINIYWHYQSVLYTQFGFHINHFRNLLLTYFIFLSFCCVLIFKWYPVGNPIFFCWPIRMNLYLIRHLDWELFSQEEKTRLLLYTIQLFLFQVLNVNCDTTYCYIWGSYGLFTHYFFCTFCAFFVNHLFCYDFYDY